MSKLRDVKVSSFTKICSNAFLLVTPEYRELKKLQKIYEDDKATYSKLCRLPMKFISLDGVKVRYANEGDNKNPTLLLLSPLPQSIVAFAPIWSSLVSRYNVYALDLPGFGQSEGGVEYMTFAKQGEFLDKFIKKLGIKNVHIIGPDVGMPSALHYTCCFDNEVESLLLGDGPAISPSINGSVIDKLVKSGFWRLGFKLLGSKIFVYAASKIGYVNYSPNQEEIDDYISSYNKRIGVSTEWFKNYPKSMKDLDLVIDNLDKPLLLFWGENDVYLMPENAHIIQKRLPTTKVKVFKNCGHFSYQDQSEDFVKMIDEWIGEGKYKLQGNK